MTDMQKVARLYLAACIESEQANFPDDYRCGFYDGRKNSLAEALTSMGCEYLHAIAHFAVGWCQPDDCVLHGMCVHPDECPQPCISGAWETFIQLCEGGRD